MTAQSTFDYVPDEQEKKVAQPAAPKKTAAESVKAHIAESDSVTALAVIEIKKENALTVFTTEKGLDPFLVELETRARAAIDGFDITTIAGQDGIRSVAYSLSKSKKPLENLASDLKKESDALIDKVNSERNRGIKFIDDLQKELRRPLTEWEAMEKARVAAHEDALVAILSHGPLGLENPTSAFIESRLNSLHALPKRDWQEFMARANSAYKETGDALAIAFGKALTAEENAAELARLREEQAAREKKAREDKIAADAAEAARKEAERVAEITARNLAEVAEKAAAIAQKVIDDQAAALAKAEQDKKDAAKALEDAKYVAELARKAALEKAESDKAAALKKQEDDIAAAKKVIDDAAAKRAADQKHKETVNNEAMNALNGALQREGTVLVVADLRAIITVIAKGEVQNVSIKY